MSQCSLIIWLIYSYVGERFVGAACTLCHIDFNMFRQWQPQTNNICNSLEDTISLGVELREHVKVKVATNYKPVQPTSHSLTYKYLYITYIDVLWFSYYSRNVGRMLLLPMAHITVVLWYESHAEENRACSNCRIL